MRNKIIATSLVAAMLAGGIANANVADDLNFYAGVDASMSYTNFGADLKDYLLSNQGNVSHSPSYGFAPFIGAKLHENVAVEVGYQYVGKNNWEDLNNLSGKTTLKTFYVDAVGSYKLNESFSALGTLGLANNSVRVENEQSANTNTVYVNGIENHSKIGVRFGTGLKYDCNENLAVRAMVKHQRIGKHNDAKLDVANTSMTLGTRYTF